jgi:hypothetical protein
MKDAMNDAVEIPAREASGLRSWARRRHDAYVAELDRYELDRSAWEATSTQHAAAVASAHHFAARVTAARRSTAAFGITDHARQRFAQRAAGDGAGFGTYDDFLRVLIAEDGRQVVERPRWALSRRAASMFVQVGDWLLIVCEPGRRRGEWSIVTVLARDAGARGSGMDWREAIARRATAFQPSHLVANPGPLPSRPRRPRRPLSVALGLGR